ncbi:MAG: hypothetical protein RR394_10055 [Oscillospiraceae bacterium]
MNVIYKALCNEQKRIIIEGEMRQKEDIQADLKDLDDLFELALAKEKIWKLRQSTI